MSDDNDLITQFCAITGESSPHIAENYLIAHEFDLERAVDFYIDHPPQEAGNQEPAAFHDPPQAAAAARELQPSVVEVCLGSGTLYADALVGFAVADGGEGPLGRIAIKTGSRCAPPDTSDDVYGADPIPDDDDDENAGLAQLAHQRASALAARQEAEQLMEGMMGAAANMIRRAGIDADMLAVQGQGLGAATGGPSQRARRGGPSPGPVGLADMDEDVEASAAALPEEQYGSYHRQQQQEMLDHYRHLAQQHQTTGFQHAAAAAGTMQQQVGDEAVPAGTADAGAGEEGPPVDLPEGINLEEARMLEAAMLGVPYQGRIPDFNAAAAAGPPLSPGAMEQRNLRAEQDLAYEESLALDRAKQESIAEAQAVAEAQDRAEQEAAAAAARAELQAQQAVAEVLEAKRKRLASTQEAAAGEPGSFSVLVRLPDGSRKGRRCRPGDSLQTVFDFVDVQCSSTEAASGAGSEGGCGGLKPGAYRLVTQFPRKVYMEGSGESMQDAGITTDTALFVEQL